MVDKVLQWLEDGSLAVAIRQSTWQYPVLEIVHITGIVLLVGPAFMFDLRLLGFAQKLSVESLAGYLLPWSRRALLLILPSGFFLFMTNASTLAYDEVFWLKMGLLLVAGTNALLFHRITHHRLRSTNDSIPTFSAKFAAVASIILWLSIIACGRLLAY